MELSPRRAARVLLVDDADRLLMFSGFDPARPEHRFWVTVGGGLDPGESSAEGAVREVAEETGLRLDPALLGEPVRTDVVEFPFEGVWYRQEQIFYFVRVAPFDVSTAGFDEVERRSIDGNRWWSLAELRDTTEPIYPKDLPDLLENVLTRAVPLEEPC
jgi:8-oxo-dGTP pyrophosphatase MutT (NUDIX family)